MLMEFACAVAPAWCSFPCGRCQRWLVVFLTFFRRGRCHLSFQAAGVMLTEWKKRVAGEIPTHGVNVPLDWKPPQVKEE